MHPRNIFALNPPSFSDLATKYQQFRKFCYIGRGGVICYNFKNVDAARCLAEILLYEYFGLNVSFAAQYLVPRVPQRLNYLLFIQDLVRFNNFEANVNGIDIGTGASCIYPLIGAKCFGWNFYCTELDEFSIKTAKQNVEKNFLQNNIHIYQTTSDIIFERLFMETNINFTFSMCNPPFFDSIEIKERFFQFNNNVENIVFDSCTINTPNSSTTAKLNEVCVKGGELSFVSKIVQESFTWKHRIKIFTTMVGKKSSIAPLKKLLVSLSSDVKILFHTLKQGRTQRWVIVWSFDSLIQFSSQ